MHAALPAGLIAGVVLSLGACTTTAPRPEAAEVAAAVVVDDRYPELRAHFPGGVTGVPDIVYDSPAGFRPLTLDLYLPPRSSNVSASPLVLFIHGGAWRTGHARAAGALADFPGVLAALARRGFVVASVNYRLSEEAPYPAAADDVRKAIRFLRDNSGRFGIEPNDTVLWGASAGAHLAALVATSCGSNGPPGEAGAHAQRQSGCVQGVVSWYGIFDLATLEPPDQAPRSPTAAFLACNPHECRAIAAEASPTTHVDPSDPPFLILHGLSDQVVPPEQSRRMEGLLRAAGVPVQAEYLAGVGHSWIAATPEETRRATHTALDRTFRFLDELTRRHR